LVSKKSEDYMHTTLDNKDLAEFLLCSRCFVSLLLADRMFAASFLLRKLIVLLSTFTYD
jgi:hypothetical protein